MPPGGGFEAAVDCHKGFYSGTFDEGFYSVTFDEGFYSVTFEEGFYSVTFDEDTIVPQHKLLEHAVTHASR
jgi:hypothetical protein